MRKSLPSFHSPRPFCDLKWVTYNDAGVEFYTKLRPKERYLEYMQSFIVNGISDLSNMRPDRFGRFGTL